jgi:hypothetical protein
MEKGQMDLELYNDSRYGVQGLQKWILEDG